MSLGSLGAGGYTVPDTGSQSLGGGLTSLPSGYPASSAVAVPFSASQGDLGVLYATDGAAAITLSPAAGGAAGSVTTLIVVADGGRAPTVSAPFLASDRDSKIKKIRQDTE